MLLNQKVISQAKKTRGYLEKKSSGFISIWQRRYFMILDNNLNYYADETLQELRKSIELSEINSIKIIEDSEFHIVTKKRIYELKAEDEDNRDLWVASLNILTNQKSITSSHSFLTQIPDNKIVPTRPHSRPKKQSKTSSSPPPIRKMSSMIVESQKVDPESAESRFFLRMGFPKLSNACKHDNIRNKIILVKEQKSFYFIISSKTPLFSHEDEDFLNEDIIKPIQPNTLYHCQNSKIEHPKPAQICRCSEIQAIQEDPSKISIIFGKKSITIQKNPKKMDVADSLNLVKRINHAVQVAKQYYHVSGIKIRRNIDKMLYKFESKEASMIEIVKREMEKCYQECKDLNSKNYLRKNLEQIRKAMKQIINCCDVLEPPRPEFKQKFIKEFYVQIMSLINKTWGNQQKNMPIVEQKASILLINDLCKMIKQFIKDNKMFEGMIAMHKNLMQKYQEEIISKIDSCFTLEENQILEEINVEITGQDQIIETLTTYFYSNTIYRQFHIDVRLILYELNEMPVHEKILEEYLSLFKTVFKHITDMTHRSIQRWKDLKLILGTCNEIQFMKNSLFDEMYSKMGQQYASLKKSIKNRYIKELQMEVSNTEIILVKNLFVMTFSAIDKAILSKHFDQLQIKQICQQILSKLKHFEKINKYVRRNIFQASFEEICYFYYSTIIKFNRNNCPRNQPADFFIKKMGNQIKIIGQFFQGHINNDKIYAHLKDLTLLKEFIQCNLPQIKKICKTLKKQFGNSFTQTAVMNLLTMRDMNKQVLDNFVLECNQIVKNSADSPEDNSLASSSLESFLDNWNNARSRKSTLTLSLNQFYENQQSMLQNKYNCSVWKQGYLTKKKVSKHSTTPNEIRAFFQINHSRLEQYESENKEEIMIIYELHNVKRCTLHPEKHYMFIVEFNDFKLQFKAETSEQAKEWIKNIYEEIGALSSLKELLMEKERPSEVSVYQTFKNANDPSTMESMRTMKDRSRQKSTSGSPMLKKAKRLTNKQRSQEPSPERLLKPAKEQKQVKESKQTKEMKAKRESRIKKEAGEDSCGRCSRGFFF